VNAVRCAWIVLRKDLLVELRSREIIYTAVFFAALLVVIFTVALPRDGRVDDRMAPGMLWATIAFAGTIALGRAFDREREDDTMRALLLSPAPRLAVFLGKAAAIAMLILMVAAVATPLFGLFLTNARLLDHVLPLLTLLVLGSVGFGVVGSVFAAALLRVRSRDILLPIVLYPILIPLFFAATNATLALCEQNANLDKAWYWISLLAAYDGVFLILSLWLFESLVIE
jgi:heme exporter protein B